MLWLAPPSNGGGKNRIRKHPGVPLGRLSNPSRPKPATMEKPQAHRSNPCPGIAVVRAIARAAATAPALPQNYDHLTKAREAQSKRQNPSDQVWETAMTPAPTHAAALCFAPGV